MTAPLITQLYKPENVIEIMLVLTPNSSAQDWHDNTLICILPPLNDLGQKEKKIRYSKIYDSFYPD